MQGAGTVKDKQETLAPGESKMLTLADNPEPLLNNELIDELERLLQWAREGKLVGLATVSMWNTRSMGSGWHFPIGATDSLKVIGACADLQFRIQHAIDDEPSNFYGPEGA